LLPFFDGHHWLRMITYIGLRNKYTKYNVKKQYYEKGILGNR
jgi:hypothetical protein